jgi:hypothetical protein
MLDEWNFRIVENRLVLVEAINSQTRSIRVADTATEEQFTVEAAVSVDLHGLQVQKQYGFSVNVYTAKNLDGVKTEFVDFFEAVDVDQEMESFLSAFKAYPKKVRFELVDYQEV